MLGLRYLYGDVRQPVAGFWFRCRRCSIPEDDSVYRPHDLTEYFEGDTESVVNAVNADHFTLAAQFQFDVPCDKVNREVNAGTDFTPLVLQDVATSGADVVCNPGHTMDRCRQICAVARASLSFGDCCV